MMINWDSSPERWKDRQRLFKAAMGPDLTEKINLALGTTVGSDNLLTFLREALEGEFGQDIQERVRTTLALSSDQPKTSEIQREV